MLAHEHLKTMYATKPVVLDEGQTMTHSIRSHQTLSYSHQCGVTIYVWLMKGTLETQDTCWSATHVWNMEVMMCAN